MKVNNNNMVSVLDTLVAGSDDKFDGVMKQHRHHYGQFYKIYKTMNRKVEDDIEYIDNEDGSATFKIKGLDVDDVVKASNKTGDYNPLVNTTVNIDGDGEFVNVRISVDQ